MNASFPVKIAKIFVENFLIIFFALVSCGTFDVRGVANTAKFCNIEMYTEETFLDC
jgi:hypothetical protein